MPLTPLDIHNKTFSKGFRGYDEDEVNEFLDQVIKDYELVLREKKDLESRVKDLESQITRFHNMEDTLNKSIIIAQETAEDVKRNAHTEAKLILKEAEKNADRIINESLVKSRKVALEVEEMHKASKVFRNRFKMLIETQLDMLNSNDWDYLLSMELSPQQDVPSFSPELEEEQPLAPIDEASSVDYNF